VKKTQRESQKGFTLIEVIVTLVLVGIISLFAGAAIVSAVQGFVMARDNAETAQKVHVAMNRISHDLLLATNIAGTANSISFDTLRAAGTPALNQTLTLDGAGRVTLNGQPLLDEVTSLQISYISYTAGGVEVINPSYSANTRGVEIQMTRAVPIRNGTVNVQYTDRVFPRNIPQNQGML